MYSFINTASIHQLYSKRLTKLDPTAGTQAASALGNDSVGSQSSSDELSAALDLLLLSARYKRTQNTSKNERKLLRYRFSYILLLSHVGFRFKFGFKASTLFGWRTEPKGLVVWFHFNVEMRSQWKAVTPPQYSENFKTFLSLTIRLPCQFSPQRTLHSKSVLIFTIVGVTSLGSFFAIRIFFMHSKLLRLPLLSNRPGEVKKPRTNRKK